MKKNNTRRKNISMQAIFHSRACICIKTIVFIAMGLCRIAGSFAQTEIADTNEIENVTEVLITANRLGTERLNTSRQIEVISRKQIELAQPATMADMLQQSGKVFVQKSQQGGGSPVLRGFESSRVLLVVDGVRMNNATYRAGHLQDIITLDPFMLERTEIFFGSGSTLFGSDALGGVVYLQSKNPQFYESKKLGFNAGGTTRFATANNGITQNAWFNLGNNKISLLANFSYNDFGDLRMGQGRNFTGIDTFGLRRRYQTRLNGRDTLLMNPDPFVQKSSGYEQWDMHVKLAFKTFNDRLLHKLNYQNSSSDLIPRYDRLTDVRNNSLRFSTWDYVPQNRKLYSYTAEFQQSKEIQHRLILAVQTLEVGRVTRNFRNPNERTQLDNTRMITGNYDISYKINSKLNIAGGLEFAANNVNSVSTNQNVTNQTKTEIFDTRYADSFARTSSFSAFTQVNYAMIPDKLLIEAGARFSSYSLEAGFSQRHVSKLPFRTADFSTLMPVFNLGVMVNLGVKNLWLKASASTGYRNPNIDDMTKLFESATKIKVIVPNLNLKSESTQTVDVNINYHNSRMNIELGGFYTLVKNLLIDQKAQFNGLDSLFYNGSNTKVYQLTNAAAGYVRGIYLASKFKIADNFFFDFSYSSTFGRYKANSESNEVPLDHIAPDFGRIGIRYAKGNWVLENFVLFNGTKPASEYSPSGEDNAQYAPGGYMPSWYTLNFRGQYTLNQHVQLGLNIENIADARYRTFSSGINGAGRNVVGSLKIQF